MLWLQTVLCFAVWVSYGVWLARSSVARAKPPRFKRGLVIGPAVLILGMAVLAGAFSFVATSGGLTGGALRPWAMAVVLVAGLLFVHAQCMGALMLVSSSLRPETRPHRQASVQKEDSP